MHTVDIARTGAHTLPRPGGVLARAWRGYVAGWVWYVRSGHAPPGDAAWGIAFGTSTTGEEGR